MNRDSNTLDNILNTPVYNAYAYSYPHKTAYRPLSPKIPLTTLWEKENLQALFLYVHIPFCTMRCGFCNLFTLAQPTTELPDLYLNALERQIQALSQVIEKSQFARYAIGGGTPTYLSVKQLERLFTLTDFVGMEIPRAIECSPETITKEKVQLLNQFNISRISMGIQSFTSSEIKQLVRPQNNSTIKQSIETIREYNSSADLNLDLIYGIKGQTTDSWLYSLKAALTFSPEELYLYPLYVREKTGLGNKEYKNNIVVKSEEHNMINLYRVGRDFLLENGYEQISMRMFRKVSLPKQNQPSYSCQEDGMLGLGAGARSYTQRLHYSSEYSVGRKGVQDIINTYINKSYDEFLYADYGVHVSQEEQKRRFVMQSLLLVEGIELQSYYEKFNTPCIDDFPQLNELIDLHLAYQSDDKIKLTDSGLERADSIGPWFISTDVKQRMKEYTIS